MLKTITPAELDSRLRNNEKIFLLDVRAEEKYDDYHIEDSNLEGINIPKTQIFETAGTKEAKDSLPTKREIIVSCTTGNSAAKCAKILSEQAYDVIVLEGGITAWKDYLNKKQD